MALFLNKYLLISLILLILYKIIKKPILKKYFFYALTVVFFSWIILDLGTVIHLELAEILLYSRDNIVLLGNCKIIDNSWTEDLSLLSCTLEDVNFY